MKTVAFDPRGFDPGDGRGQGPNFGKAVAAAEKMKLRYDIQDDAFMVFFPDEANSEVRAKAHLFMATQDGHQWIIALEDEHGNVYQLGNKKGPVSGHSNLNSAVSAFVRYAKLGDRVETLALLFVAAVS